MGVVADSLSRLVFGNESTTPFLVRLPLAWGLGGASIWRTIVIFFAGES